MPIDRCWSERASLLNPRRPLENFEDAPAAGQSLSGEGGPRCSHSLPCWGQGPVHLLVASTSVGAETTVCRPTSLPAATLPPSPISSPFPYRLVLNLGCLRMFPLVPSLMHSTAGAHPRAAPASAGGGPHPRLRKQPLRSLLSRLPSWLCSATGVA